MTFTQEVLKKISEQPPLVIERDCYAVIKGEEHPSWASMKICPDLWKITRPIMYIIHNAPRQYYLASSLRYYHYQQDDLVSMKETIRKINLDCGDKKPIQIIEILGSEKSFKDDFLVVENNFPIEVYQYVQWDLISSLLNEKKSVVDEQRNNLYRDFGFTGDRNSKRGSNTLGLSHAQTFMGTSDTNVVNLFVALSHLLLREFPDLKESLYCDEFRKSFWAATIHEDNIIESLRVHRTNFKQLLLRKHKDVQNSMTKNFAYVFTISHFAANGTDLVRDGVTLYGKAGADRFMKTVAKFQVAITTMQKLYAAVPCWQKELKWDLLPSCGENRRQLHGCHIDKGILYSLFSSGMHKLWMKYPILQANIECAAVFYSAIPLSECSDHFWHACNMLHENPCELKDRKGNPLSMLDEISVLEFGYALHLHIFEQVEKHRNGTLDYSVNQRFQPHLPNAPTYAQSELSITSLSQLVKHSRELKKSIAGQNAFFYYGIALEIIKRDVFGAGELTANHILGVMTNNGDVPAKFATLAEVASSTKTARFLLQSFKFDNDDPDSDFRQLLKSVASSLHITIREAEELCCLATKLIGNPEHLDFEKVSFRCCEDSPRRIEENGAVLFNINALHRYCDVVYSDMFLYQFRDGKMKMVDNKGIEQDAPVLLFDPPSLELASLKATYWDDNKRVFKRSFDYKRIAKSKMVHLREYFIPRGLRKQVGKRKLSSMFDNLVMKNNGRVDEKILNMLLLPSYNTICLSSRVREPLDIRGIVCTTLYGPKNEDAINNSFDGKKKRTSRKHKTSQQRFQPPQFASIFTSNPNTLGWLNHCQAIIGESQQGEDGSVSKLTEKECIPMEAEKQTDKIDSLTADHANTSSTALSTTVNEISESLVTDLEYIPIEAHKPIHNTECLRADHGNTSSTPLRTKINEMCESTVQAKTIQNIDDRTKMRTTTAENEDDSTSDNAEKCQASLQKPVLYATRKASIIFKIHKHTVPSAKSGQSHISQMFYSAFLRIPKEAKECHGLTEDEYIPPPAFALYPTGEDKRMTFEMMQKVDEHVALETHKKILQNVLRDIRKVGEDSARYLKLKASGKIPSQAALSYNQRRKEKRKHNRKKKRKTVFWENEKSSKTMPALKQGEQPSKTMPAPKQGEQPSFVTLNKSPRKMKPTKQNKKKAKLPLPPEYDESRPIVFGNRLIRCFADVEDAKNYCLWSFIFGYSHLLNKNDPALRSLFFLDDNNDRNSKEGIVDIDGVRQYKVFYNPNEALVSKQDKCKEPFAVAVQYNAGGLAYYLCNGNGIRRSQVLLSMPHKTWTKSNNGESVAFEMIEILEHYVLKERSQVFERCSVNVLLLGSDGSTSEQPLDRVFEDAPYQCYLYAQRNNLMEAPKWKTLLKSIDYSKEEDARAIAVNTTKSVEEDARAIAVNTTKSVRFEI